MHLEPLDFVPLWLLLAFVALILALAMEAGFRLGVSRRARYPDEKEPAGAMVGSILGLLALVLGFTFSLAASRFDARRQAVLEEANAIGTTYLRARLLPAAERAAIEGLLREYTAIRIRAVTHPDKQAIKEAEAIQHKLWEQASLAAEQTKGSLMTGLFVQSLNELIDIHSKRIMVGLRSRIPVAIWLSVLGLAALGMASVGYQSGLASTQHSPAMLGLLVAFTVVLALIADLDRGQEGLLQISQQSMVDVQQSMEPESAAKP